MTKSISLRELSQWTAATTLVAAGSLALFSAATLDKLSRGGDVEIDVNAFRKLGSTSLALDRTDDERLIREESRLIAQASSAAAEKLPATRTAFKRIRLHPKVAKKAVKKADIVARIEAAPAPLETAGVPSAERRMAGTPIVLSAEDAAEISALETAQDPFESRALAQVYRNLRFQFVTAVDHADAPLIAQEKEEFPAESIAIAREAGATEYDEVPEFHAEDFVIREASNALVAENEPSEMAAPVAVETAPAKLAGESDSVPPSDSVTVSASVAERAPSPEKKFDPSGPTADAATMNTLIKPEKDSRKEAAPVVAAVSSPGLDLVPDSAPAKVDIRSGLTVNSHETEVKQATGPPETPKTTQIDSPTSLQAKSPSGFDAPPETPTQITQNIAKTSPEMPAVTATDLSEYSNDRASVYQGMPSEGADSDEESSGYSANNQTDGIVDGDFTARPTVVTNHALVGGASIIKSAQTNSSLTIGNSGGAGARNSGGSGNVRSRKILGKNVSPNALAPKKSQTLAATFDPNTGGEAIVEAAPRKSTKKEYGYGVSRDDHGITIDWNEDKADGGKYADTSLGGKVFVGRPGEAFANLPNGNKILTTQSSASAGPAEPAVDTKKCETARIGMEAFNTGAEKEALSICRRELSVEGSREGPQARWWESYENEAEHWPTLSYQKPGAASATNRTPLLSTASIRILSAISKTNTHTGTGIIFGEVAKGLEIQLLGRSDSPIYLDSGMKVSADSATSRQFVFLNVAPGQPLLVVKDREKNVSGAIPLIVKSGMATNLKVSEPREAELDLVVLDASAAKETRLANMTAEVIGQPGRLGVTDAKGVVKIRKIAVFDDFPIYVDVLKNDKGYKNRFRIRPAALGRGPLPFFFFDEKRVGGWLAQLAGGLSPYSGLIAGVAPAADLPKAKGESRYLKIGILEKKSSLVPERYVLDEKERLVSESTLRTGRARYIGVQIPEGPAIPTIVDEKGEVRWSELVYAQPGVINVVNPEL
ncbi:MAG: hypothetical protein JST04_14370 [Bdellovibrionales bacterium]|nr:hypothetical protein [Bdellovibrionales bacterium]